jgi:hypothetical protein
VSSEPIRQRQQTHEGKPPKRRAAIIRIFGALKRYEDSRRRRHEKETSETDLVMARWTRRVGLFTLALVLVGSITGAIFWEQLQVMQGQLDETALEQRPWIYSETPVIQSRITRNQLGWYLINLKFRLHNVGHTPARFVYLTPVSAVLPDLSGIPARVNEICGKSVGRSNYVGTTIFPGQDFSYTPSVGINPSEIETAFRSRFVPNFVVLGCVIYQLPTGDKQHHTGFAYLIEQTKNGDPRNAIPLPADPQNISLDDLLLVPWISENSFDAD